MGKTSKWIRNLLTGKKDKEKEKNVSINEPSSIAIHENPTTPTSIPPTTRKEKRRWSFRRSSATATGHKDLNSRDTLSTTPSSVLTLFESEKDQKKHAMAVAFATVAAADAAVAAAQATAAMMRLTASAGGRVSAVEDAAATKIQSVFRSYLARKALSALKGLVKLQAMVRGHLVRKQATATLRCMQALVTVQARARAQRIRMNDEPNPYNHRQMTPRRTTQLDNRSRQCHHDLMEENIKIVEMDLGQSNQNKNSTNSYSSNPRSEHRNSTHRKPDHVGGQHTSPAPSALTELSPTKASSGHFEDYNSLGTAQISPQSQYYYSAISTKPDPSRAPFAYSRTQYAESILSYSEYQFFPNYMANTESSKAKVRSHSAPKLRPDSSSYERPSSATRRRPSIEGRNVPRAVRMQRSSSHVGSTAQNYQYPWSAVKLDKSTVSLIDSECGSTSTVLTNPNYCRSLVGFDIQGNRY